MGIRGFTLPILASMVAAGCCVCSAMGLQPETEPQEPPPEPAVPPGPGEAPPLTLADLARDREVAFRFNARGELGLNAGLRDAPGDVTVSRVGGGLSTAIPIRQFAQLDLGIDYEFSHYAFSNATGFAAGFDSPWEKIHRETFSARFSQQQTLTLSWFVGGTVGLSHEEGASLSDSLVGSAFAGARMALAENFFVTGGVVVRSQLEESALIVPLPGIEWQIDERVRLSTAGQLGATLEYRASDQLRFRIGGEYQLRDFRLSDTGAAPDGVGRDRRVPIAAGLIYDATPRLTVELSGGAYLWQQFRLMDERGDLLAEIDARPTPFGSLSIGYRF